MKSYSEVDELVARLKEQGKSKTEIIVAAAEAEIGWPYVWGAVGAQCTPAKREYYAGRSSCPEAEAQQTIKKCQALNGSGKSCGGCEYYPGNRRTLIDDCQGFVKQVCSRVGISFTGGGATSMWNGSGNWKEKGTRDSLPETLCCIFWQASDKKTMSHIGFYIGGGYMIHCSGTVKKEKLSSRVTHWAIPKGLDGSVPTDKPTLRRGDRGDYVVELQKDLIQLRYSVGSSGADGIFGRNTETAVKAFQSNSGLVVDGIVGKRTWTALDEAIAGGTKLYTVTIQHLTKAKADELIRQYPGAMKKEEGGLIRMSFWEIAKAAGIPALLLTLIITTWVQTRAVKRGVQALLRDRLIQGYKFYAAQGWADVDDRSNLENVYVQYHALGANGVMDDLREKFLHLPLGPQHPAP